MERSTPAKLFVCLCKIAPAHAQRSVKSWAGGAPLPAQAEAIRNEHLRYTYELGEKGVTWAAGPFADFSGTLSIYAVSSLEEAKRAKRNDPFFVNGIFYDDKYFEWFIHVPLSEASSAHREIIEKGLRSARITSRAESKLAGRTPEKLFVCLSKLASFPKGAGAILREHFRYQYDYLAERGITWAGGVLGNFEGSLQIYTVNSVEDARKAVQNDPFSVNGIFYDNEYFQWLIHMPFSKCSPAHRERLRQDLIKVGIRPG